MSLSSRDEWVELIFPLFVFSPSGIFCNQAFPEHHLPLKFYHRSQRTCLGFTIYWVLTVNRAQLSGHQTAAPEDLALPQRGNMPRKCAFCRPRAEVVLYIGKQLERSAPGRPEGFLESYTHTGRAVGISEERLSYRVEIFQPSVQKSPAYFSHPPVIQRPFQLSDSQRVLVFILPFPFATLIS